PISLIGSLYKIIAKILANRLVGVLGDIVNEVQSAFIADRQILDGPFILNEVLQWCKVKKKQSLIFKVDFEKAYDSVQWDFLDDVLSKFGFGEKWRKWIQCCLRSSRGSIIINGSPTEEFQFCKGLKQGDPLSPFLFILIMESLHLSFQRVVDAGMFKGIKLGASVNISHMFYADDAVFVGQWCESNISTLVHVLECFYRASGLRINMSKSKIMGVYVDSDKVKRAALKLGCLILKPPFLYLGLIVGGSMSRVHAWNEVVERVKKRLSKWKMKTLSIGGRLTLLKSVLGSMPIFHMSIFKVPSGVLRTLESIRSHFFNGHDSNSKKASWVNWKKVLAPKERGGLGVSSLYALNRGLMFKWVWRFYTQDSSLWARVIKAIHGDDGKMGVITRAGSKSCWMNIVHETNALLNKGIDLIKFMRIKLGNGQITSFWEDMWSEGGTLKNRYPRIYALESSKSITVGMKVAQPSLAFSFRRAPRGGVEQEQFDEIVALVNDVILAPISDRWTWTLESSGDFSVASVRKLIDDKSIPVVDYKTRWIKYVPIKVNVHAWKVKSDSLPTRFNISRRGIYIDSIMCAICDKGAETSSHLFFSCCMVRQAVRLITRWWDVPYMEFESYDGWLAWLVNLRLPYKNKMMLEGVFYVMWWHLWTFRNKTIFEVKAPAKALFFDDVVYLLTGPIYDLIKGTCKSVVELEYHLEEVFKATSDQLDWHNPKGKPYPYDLSKPLPLIPDARGRLIILYDHFINNDLQYLKGGSSSRKYTTSITKTKVADYGHIKWIEDKIPRSTWSEAQVVYDKHTYWGTYHWGPKRQRFYGYATNMETSKGVYLKHMIIDVISLKIMEFFGYKHLEEITVQRQDDKLYKFREGDFKRLHREDIEDMLLLLV
ncbi:RNA-directed DNA polymerase, eukaryota, partial [Tanacetum coccineum]